MVRRVRVVVAAAVLSGLTLPKEPIRGFLRANDDSSCFLHYTLERSEAGPESPLIVWYQGGPGISSQVGNVFEIGPKALVNGVLVPRVGAWTEKYNLLFLDAPEGTGLSYCESPSSLPSLSEDIAEHMRTALQDFYELHPKMVSSALFLAGEHYAGHVLPPLAALLLRKPLITPLRGIAIGNGHTHPITQVLTRSESAKYFGLVDDGPCYDWAFSNSTAASFLAETGRFEESFDARGRLEFAVAECSAGVNLRDVRTTVQFQDSLYTPLDKLIAENPDFLLSKYLTERNESGQFLKSHTHFTAFNPNVVNTLRADVMRSMMNYVGEALDSGIPVLLYQGVHDWIDGVFSNEAWISQTPWRGQTAYNEQVRQAWSLDIELVGYRRSHGPLTHIVVRNAGHMVALDQPEVARAMIDIFINEALSNSGTATADT